MYAAPTISPLDFKGEIYAILDERGNIMGTGTKEVCEVLIYIIGKLRATRVVLDRKHVIEPQRPNVRGLSMY